MKTIVAFPALLIAVSGGACSSTLTGTAGTGGSGGAAAAGMGGRGGAAGQSTGGTGPTELTCAKAPDTNDPECHPEDSVLWQRNVMVPSLEGGWPALEGECTPAATCVFAVRLSSSCAQGSELQTYVCCPFYYRLGVNAPALPAQGGWVPGKTTDACPKANPGQDAACALPLSETCPVDGLVCNYEAAWTGGTHYYNFVCCGGIWLFGYACPADAGTD